MPVAIWTHALVCLGIVSACLPCYKPLFRGVVEKLRSIRTSRSSTLRPSGSLKKSALADPYSHLDGKETEINGSKTAIFDQDQWSAPSRPGVNSAVKSADNGTHRDDIELGLVNKH